MTLKARQGAGKIWQIKGPSSKMLCFRFGLCFSRVWWVEQLASAHAAAAIQEHFKRMVSYGHDCV